MPENIEIKKLAKGEIGWAKSLVTMFGSDDGDENFAPPSDDYCAKMLAREDFHVIVALDGGRLVGGVTAYEMKMFKRETTEMFLYEIEVAETHRRQGVGKALIERLMLICREKGIVEMFVGTEKENTPARRLYGSTGGKADEDSVWFNYLFD